MSEITELGKFAKIESGFAFPSEAFSEAGLPVARMSDLKNGCVDLSNAARVQPDAVHGLERFKLKTGDFLIGMSGSLDAYGVVGDDGETGYLNQRVGRLAIEDEYSADYRYFSHALSSEKYIGYAKNVATGIAQLNISSRQVEKFSFFIPRLSEQKTIASILDTLDTQIRQTEAIIAKLQQVKQGLLHDLLTRGIDANGQLRPPRDQVPELYKESPLGWIPREWEVISLGDVAKRSSGILQTGPFGSQLHAEEYVDWGVPVIMPQDLFGESINKSKIAYITEARARKLLRHRVKDNDVIFSRRGDLSRCVAISDSEEGWICGTGCLLARLPESEVLGEWLSLTYKQAWSQTQIDGMAVGSTMPNLNTQILGKLLLAKPSSDEQRVILNLYRESENRQRLEKEKVAKLKIQKSGLMDDLLAGRVRVTSLLDTVKAS